jgi:hypothetical protein
LRWIVCLWCAWVIAFLVLKLLLPLSLTLSLPILYCLSIIIPLQKHDQKTQMQGQVMSSSTTTKDLHRQQGRQRQNFELHRNSLAMKTWNNCLSEWFDCYRKSWNLPFLGYLKPFMHIVWSRSYLQSFLFYHINSYLQSSTPNRSFPNLGARLLLRGVVCHIPKFPFLNVNHFPKKSNFYKGFHYLNPNDFIMYFNEFKESKYLNCVQNYILNYSFIWVVKTLIIVSKKLFKRISIS